MWVISSLNFITYTAAPLQNKREKMMKNVNVMPNFDVFFKQVTDMLPKGLFSLHQDLEKNLRVGLYSALRKMNLVTREGFEVQSAVLQRTRARLEALEAQVAAFEAAQLSKQPPTLSNQSNQAE